MLFFLVLPIFLPKFRVKCTFASLGTNLLTSPINRSGKPYNVDVPPVNTISLYNGFLKSKSTLAIELANISGIAILITIYTI